MTSRDEVTQLLLSWSNGNEAALNELMPLVYSELRRMASRHLATQAAGHTLQPTALIHEAYFRLVGDGSGRQWQDRGHFFRVAAKAMRHVIIDHARAQLASKRGGGQSEIALDDATAISPERAGPVVALHDALTGLSKVNSRQAEVVELKYFGGLTTEEISEALSVSSETVMRDWRAAKAWLYVQLNPPQQAKRGTSA